MPTFVYLLRCADGTLYVGSTSDLGERLARHQAGEGSTWTRKRRPVAMIYAEKYATLNQAVARERQLKGWTRAKKEALIAGELARLKRL